MLNDFVISFKYCTVYSVHVHIFFYIIFFFMFFGDHLGLYYSFLHCIQYVALCCCVVAAAAAPLF